MTTQTPTEIATESMKGCGERQLGFPDDICSKKELCSRCSSKIQAHKQDWEGELKRLEKIRFCSTHYCKVSEESYDNKVKWRIELKQALKILEGGK